MSGARRVIGRHTGAEFEGGDVHRGRGVNEPMPGVEPEPHYDGDGPAGARAPAQAPHAGFAQPGLCGGAGQPAEMVGAAGLTLSEWPPYPTMSKGT